MSGTLHTVAELDGFIKKASKLLTPEEIGDLVEYIARYPESGVLIRGTGGIRKLRWARESKGKSGGVRIIYFYFSENTPILLMRMYAKNEKQDLNKAERNELAGLTAILARSYRRPCGKTH